VKPVIGHWKWDADSQTLSRPDASVRYLGPDPDRLRSGHSLWLRFDLALAGKRLVLPVEQRLAGRDSNFRALWYRVDFRRAGLSSSLWAAAERLIADALACWPRGELIDALPTGVGVQGGWINGAFREQFYRLYLPTYVGSPTLSGDSSTPCHEQGWTFSPGRGGGGAVDLKAAAGRGFHAFRQAARNAADSYPSLTAGDRILIFTPGQQSMTRLVYTDETFATGRFALSAAHRGQEWLWSIFETASEFPDVHAPQAERAGFLTRLERALAQPTSKRNERPADLTQEQQERAYSAIHEALFAVPEGAIESESLQAPPLVVQARAPWRRAGYLNLECLTAMRLATSELKAAFDDEPATEHLLVSPAGPAFDPRSAALYAPDGSSLALESTTDWLGLAPRKLRLRCRLGGLDWPVLVHRLDRRPEGSWDYRPQLLSRWLIDHDECLGAWRGEGHAGRPPAHLWDAMRQFIEEAILSWGDSMPAGPAPQSLATRGGWYEGQWRGPEFQRLLARPISPERIARTDRWRPFTPARLWRRTDATPPDHVEEPSGYGLCETGPPVPYEKLSDGNPSARLFASAYIVMQQREEQTRYDLLDYVDEQDSVRLGGSHRRMASAGMIRIDANTPLADVGGKMPWPAREQVEEPGLDLWRRLRDAREGGLREGETTTLYGGYFLDRLYADSIRCTTLGGTIEDFDYLMFGPGNVFVR
jgi:hypothetical protein